MNPTLKMMVLIPTLLVAILCLLNDEGIGSFSKKVGGTYIFFSVLSIVFGVLWRASVPADLPARMEKQVPESQTEGEAVKDEAKEAKSAAANP